jgi:hypothetical protein
VRPCFASFPVASSWSLPSSSAGTLPPLGNQMVHSLTPFSPLLNHPPNT